jgi:DNA ligase-1
MEKILKSFDKLYKKTSTGAIQTWEVTVVINDEDKPTIVSRYGQNGGKIQESREVILEGKNIGRSNETDSIQQAELQAEADWTKQLKKGYVKSFADAMNGKTDAIIEGGIVPMLAHKFSEQAHKIKYPALAQCKLDGNRCIAVYKDGKYTLWSRTRKPITSMPHIIKALEESGCCHSLDGELYNHDYHDNFEQLTSYIRVEEPKEGCEIVQYHIYDAPENMGQNKNRNEYLQMDVKEKVKNYPQLYVVETLIVNNEDELMEAFDHFLEEGYEGCMVRNMDGLYVNKRSCDLQKIKEFSDSEFKIIGVKVGTKGSMAGKAVFTCELPNKETFDCKMKGDMNELTKYANDPSLVLGKQLTVKYQGYTKYGVPRFPVGLRFREDL